MNKLIFFIIIIIIISIYLTYYNGYIDLSNYEEKIYSQNGEDGVTMKLIELIYEGPYNKYYVEFGVQDGEECNTHILRENYNWNGLLMDGSNSNHSINLKKEFITKENILSLFEKYNVPIHINLLSIDIDYNDFYCLKEILTKYKSDIIICEYNSSHGPDEDKVVIYNPNYMWDGTNYFGASLLSLQNLANKYNYSLVYCDKLGVNCYFVHNEIIRQKNLNFKDLNSTEHIYNPPKYGINGHPIDNSNRKYVSSDELL